MRPIGSAVQAANVIDALEDEQIFCAALGDHIAIEARQRIGAGSIQQNLVAADGFIQHRQVAILWVGLQAPRQLIRPSLVGIDGGFGAIGDRVPDGNDGCRIGGSKGVDSVEVFPAGQRGGRLQGGAGDYIAGRVIAGGVAELMLGNWARWAGQIEADSQVGKWSKLERDGIADSEGAGGYRNRRLPVKGERLSRARNNSRALEGLGDLRRANHQRIGAVQIGKAHPERLSTHTHVDHFAQGDAGCTWVTSSSAGLA